MKRTPFPLRGYGELGRGCTGEFLQGHCSAENAFMKNLHNCPRGLEMVKPRATVCFVSATHALLISVFSTFLLLDIFPLLALKTCIID